MEVKVAEAVEVMVQDTVPMLLLEHLILGEEVEEERENNFLFFRTWCRCCWWLWHRVHPATQGSVTTN